MARFVGRRATELVIALAAVLALAVLLSPALEVSGEWDVRADRPLPDASPSEAASHVDDAASDVASTGAPASLGSARVDDAHDLPHKTNPAGPAFKPLAGWPGFAEAEHEFDDEARDVQWAELTEGRLLSLVSELDGVALNRLEADCRESMCRLLLLHPSDVEPVYSIRQIYDRAGELGLGPVAAETRVEAGEPSGLRVLLRRRVGVSSPR